MIEIKNEPLEESIEQDPLQMGHPVTDPMGHPTNLPKIETETLNENMNTTTSIPYHTFDNSSVKKRNKKREYPFYVACNLPKKNVTRN